MSKSAILSRPRVVLVNRCIIKNAKDKILVIRRSKYSSTRIGMWEFPGGKLDAGQDLSHAQEREVLEETGLTILTTSRTSFVDGEILTQGKYAGLPYVIIFGQAKLVGGKVMLSKENDAYKWVTPKQALKLSITPESRKALAVLYG